MSGGIDGIDSGHGLVGREEQLTALTAALAPSDSELSLVAVEGLAGIGKTSLVRQAIAGMDATLLWVAADDTELSPDLSIIDQLIRTAPLPIEERDALWPRIAYDAVAAGETVIDLVNRLWDAGDGRIVIVVDDAHWADAASLFALAFAVRRLRVDPLTVCLVVRSEEEHSLPESIVRLVAEVGTTVPVPPLEVTDVRRLAEAIRSETVSPGVASRLLEHTGGNPLHLVELLAELPSASLSGGAELPAPRSFARAVADRFQACDPGAQRLAATVAVMGGRLPLFQTGRIAELDDPLSSLDRAVAARLVRVVDPMAAIGDLEVTPAHPLVRAAILRSLTTDQRASVHRRAGETLTGLDSLVHRLMGSPGSDDALWNEAEKTAVDLSDRGSHGAAADLWRLARTIAPTPEFAERALLTGTDEFLLAGRLEDARARRAAVVSGSESAFRHYVLARLAYILGPRDDTETHLRNAWNALMPDDGDQLRGEVAALMATQAIDRGAADEAVEWAEIAMSRAPERAARLSSAHQLAAGHGIRGSIDAGLVDLTSRLEALEVTPVSPPVAADIRCARGLLRMWRHDPGGAADDFRAALIDAERGASLAARESTRTYLGEALYRLGRWDDALRHAQRAASTASASELVWLTGSPESLLARLLAGRGSPEAAEYADRHLRACLEVGSPVGSLLARLDVLAVSICQGDIATAIRIGDEAVDIGANLVAEHFAEWRADYVEALVAVGRVDEARPIADELAADSPAPRVQSDAARARALIAGTGDPDAFDAAAEAGLALDPTAVGPYQRARLELVIGRELRRRGERRSARELLSQSLDRFRALGAAGWCGLVERELSASGQRAAPRGSSPSTELTAREQVIAQLVSRGLTNRDVAAELMISAKTVEHHLSRIYAKLGVRSRTELAHRLMAERA